MTTNTNAMNDIHEANDVRALNEEQLASVSGGFGFWDAVRIAAGAITTQSVDGAKEVLSSAGV